MLRLDFSVDDLKLPEWRTRVRRSSISDGHFTSRYEELGFYSSADFIELGARFGVNAQEVREMLSGFPQKRDSVCRMIEASMLSDAAKEQYLMRFLDRLNAIAQ